MDFKPRNLSHSHAARNAEQEDQGVAFREAAGRFGYAQEMAEFRRCQDFGVFGFQFRFS